MLYAGGKFFNLCEPRPSLIAMTPTTVSPGTASGYAVTQLYDHRPSAPWRCSSDAQWYVQVDLNQAGNGDIESWASATLLANPWIHDIVGGGTGSIDRESGTVHGGTYSAKLTIGTSTSVGFYQDIYARAGERRYVTGWGYASSGTARFRIRNLSTGKYLTSAGSWSSSPSDVGTVTAGAWTEVSKSYQVESLDDCQTQTPILRLSSLTDDGTVYIDDLYDWPRFNGCVLVGHNLGTRNTITLASDDNSGFSSPTSLDTGLPLQPSFYLYSSTGSAERYARVSTDQTANEAIPYIGELALVWFETALRDPSVGGTFELAYDEPQERHETATGDLWAYNVLTEPRRLLKFGFVLPNAAAHAEHAGIIRRCRGGLFPLVVVPQESETTVIYGRLESSWRATRVFNSYWEDEIIVAEDPTPVEIRVS